VKQSDVSLFEALARMVEKRVGDFNTKNLANTAWAFAKAGRSNMALFVVLARAVERRVSESNAQAVGNTA